MAIFKTRKQVDKARFAADICREVTVPEVIAVLNREYDSSVAQEDDAGLRANYIVHKDDQGVTYSPVFADDKSLLQPPETDKHVDILISDHGRMVLSLKSTKSSCLACPLVTPKGSTLSIDYSKFDALISMLESIKMIDVVGS